MTQLPYAATASRAYDAALEPVPSGFFEDMAAAPVASARR